MRVLLTGGSGYLGGFATPALAAAGHDLVHLARRAPASGGEWIACDLEHPPPALPRADALVHLAFSHEPGRFRGGEGDDPDGFLRRNCDGSLELFAAARAAGVPRIVTLSSRAVYGDHRRGETLVETDPPAPDSLYGRVKLAVEAGADVALRATGVYGVALGATSHKWAPLFAGYLAGKPIPPRVATELHGEDLAAALVLLLGRSTARGAFNASDLLLDHHDLLGQVRARTRCPHPPPPPAPGPPPGRMTCARLRGLGWSPGGVKRLSSFLDALFPT